MQGIKITDQLQKVWFRRQSVKLQCALGWGFAWYHLISSCKRPKLCAKRQNCKDCVWHREDPRAGVTAAVLAARHMQDWVISAGSEMSEQCELWGCIPFPHRFPVSFGNKSALQTRLSPPSVSEGSEQSDPPQSTSATVHQVQQYLTHVQMGGTCSYPPPRAGRSWVHAVREGGGQQHPLRQCWQRAEICLKFCSAEHSLPNNNSP